MKTKLITFEGIELIVPNIIIIPFESIKDFPNCCGAGKGFGEKLVPETIWGLRISHCCWIHDESWRIAKATWADFHQSNAMFLTNILKTIHARPSRFKFINALRVYRAATYYNAVSIVGAPLFGVSEER